MLLAVCMKVDRQHAQHAELPTASHSDPIQHVCATLCQDSMLQTIKCSSPTDKMFVFCVEHCSDVMWLHIALQLM